MKYFVLEPEVAGELGENTVMDTQRHPPNVVRLHYEFEGWQGDELLEAFPCYVATRSLAERLKIAGMTGLEFDVVEITRSANFEELLPSVQLPDFVRLLIKGRAGVEDFGISKDHHLVVSENALDIMKLKHCDASEFSADENEDV